MNLKKYNSVGISLNVKEVMLSFKATNNFLSFWKIVYSITPCTIYIVFVFKILLLLLHYNVEYYSMGKDYNMPPFVLFYGKFLNFLKHLSFRLSLQILNDEF